ncbi:MULTISPECIES: rhodanese-like domain-containing protein [unclassified Desulfovibrio]|uniref:rhodanese-like domain-containing protein n=1 Tax=unclassified Desulfovibrio TaxID=2593640 RepID=UPI000F5E1C43|nr:MULTISPECIES: rhodanese-like domain-containing protein [unclassified Desulfovibrio]RRD71935.1 rhodanese-like domain-containing protein [Desulfovibrio sp. OH1209_COT-279]RRD88148.1 rhodanese-like domain-containing protein [Desulfovibrio sp. OH1186_COT-070]
MKKTYQVLFVAVGLITLCLPPQAQAADVLGKYLSSFDYEERMDMKATSRDVIQWLIEDKAVLVDIRFKEEQALWGFDFAKKIPLAELPSRLKELPKDKIIVTACPHNDRANLARVYLVTQGYNAKYLTDGMRGLMDLLRGDNAKAVYEALKRK